MSTHLAVITPPVGAIRPSELGLTGLQGRRARRRRDFRAELRELFPRTAGRHRQTFIPLERSPFSSD